MFFYEKSHQYFPRLMNGRVKEMTHPFFCRNLFWASKQQILKAVKRPSHDGSLPSVYLRTDKVQAVILASPGRIF